MKAVIFDLDNCLSNDAHRVHLIDPHAADPFDAYHAAHVKDEACNLARLYREVSNEYAVIIVTMRPDTWRISTEDWLSTNYIPHIELRMPPAFDKREAVEYKTKQARMLIDMGYRVVHAYDDNSAIVQAYWNMGIGATRLSAHDLEYPL
jgi:hypothetical protein